MVVNCYMRYIYIYIYIYMTDWKSPVIAIVYQLLVYNDLVKWASHSLDDPR
jgi:hypothetical protein